jgi:hypothetical protein
MEEKYQTVNGKIFTSAFYFTKTIVWHPQANIIYNINIIIYKWYLFIYIGD